MRGGPPNITAHECRSAVQGSFSRYVPPRHYYPTQVVAAVGGNYASLITSGHTCSCGNARALSVIRPPVFPRKCHLRHPDFTSAFAFFPRQNAVRICSSNTSAVPQPSKCPRLPSKIPGSTPRAANRVLSCRRLSLGPRLRPIFLSSPPGLCLPSDFQAAEFAKSFYTSLLRGDTVRQAFLLGSAYLEGSDQPEEGHKFL